MKRDGVFLFGGGRCRPPPAHAPCPAVLLSPLGPSELLLGQGPASCPFVLSQSPQGLLVHGGALGGISWIEFNVCQRVCENARVRSMILHSNSELRHRVSLRERVCRRCVEILPYACRSAEVQPGARS